MNTYESGKRTNASLQKEIEDKDAELTRLRAELEATRAQSEVADTDIFQPPPSSQQRVDEVEAELEALRRSFSGTEEDDDNATIELSWDDVPRGTGPGSEGGDTILLHDMEVDQFPSSHRQPSQNAIDSDALTMGLELQAARQAKSNLLGSFRDQAVNTSFDFQFADTPDRPATRTYSPTSTILLPETPPRFDSDLGKRLREVTNRAEEAEVALTALDVEITNLGFGDADKDDTMAMVTTISEHFRAARLDLERLAPGEVAAGFENPSVLPEILKKAKLLSEKLNAKEKELKGAKDQHHNLKNNFEKAIIAAEKANERVRQLEMTIDNSVEESLHVRMRSQQLERDLAEKGEDVSSLSNALNKYRADVARLEDLINNMQAEQDATSSQRVEELEARVESETTGRRAAELSAVQRLARINELETTLATTKRHATDLENRLTALQTSTVPPSASFHHRQEVADLNARISSLANALATANTEVEKLKIARQRLEERVRSEAEQGARAVESLQEHLIRTVMKGNEARKRYVNGAKVRIANWELSDEREMSLSSDGLEDPKTPESASSVVRFAEWAEVETIERNEPETPGQDLGEESGSESLPGSVEVQRGRGKYKKVPRLVTYDKARRSGTGLGVSTDEEYEERPAKKGRRRYDSGIGMSSDCDFEIYDETRTQKGAGEMRNGMITPELSSDGDMEREMVDALNC